MIEKIWAYKRRPLIESEHQSPDLEVVKYENIRKGGLISIDRVKTRLKIAGPYLIICIIGGFGWFESRSFSLPMRNGSLNPALVPGICCAFLVLGGGCNLCSVLLRFNKGTIRSRSDQVEKSVSLQNHEVSSPIHPDVSTPESFVLPGGLLVFTIFVVAVLAYLYILGRIGFIYSTSILLVVVISLSIVTQYGKSSALTREGLIVMVKLIATTVVTDVIFAHVFHVAGFK